jgi:hypothetical protein
MASYLDKQSARDIHFWTFYLWWRLVWHTDPTSQDLKIFGPEIRKTWWKA